MKKFLSIIFGLLSILSIEAATSTWNAGDGDFNNIANWLVLVPTSVDTAQFTNRTTYTVSFTQVNTNVAANFNGGNIYLALGGNSYVTTNTSEIGVAAGNSNSMVVVSNGIFSVAKNFIVGDSANNCTFSLLDSGIFTNLTGGIVLMGNNSSNNVWNMAGAGMAFCDQMRVGAQSTAFNNSVIVTGSAAKLFCVNNMNIGYAGNSNIMVVNGGVVSNLLDLIIGNSVTSMNNTLFATNGAQLFSRNIYLGFNLAANSNNNALIAGASTFVTNTQSLTIGYNGGFCSYIQSNSCRVFNGVNFLIGSNTASNNTARLIGTGTTMFNSNMLYVGNNTANNSLTIDGGSISNTVRVYVGFNGASNTLVLTNGGTLYSGGTWRVGPSIGASNNVMTIYDSSIAEAVSAASIGTNCTLNMINGNPTFKSLGLTVHQGAILNVSNITTQATITGGLTLQESQVLKGNLRIQ